MYGTRQVPWQQVTKPPRKLTTSTQKVLGTLRSAAVVTARRVFSTPIVSNYCIPPLTQTPNSPPPRPNPFPSISLRLAERKPNYFSSFIHITLHTFPLLSNQLIMDKIKEVCLPTPLFGGVALTSCLFYAFGLPLVVHTISMHTIPLPSARLTRHDANDVLISV